MSGADSQLDALFRRAHAGELPNIDKVIRKVGYHPGPGWTVHTAGAVARFLRISERQVRRLIDEGMPRTPAGDRRFAYDLSEIARWRLKREEEQLADPLLRPDIPGTELERLREVTRKLKELDLADRQANLIPRDELLEGLGLLATSLRTAADHFREMSNEKAAKILDDAVSQYEAEVARQFPAPGEEHPESRGSGSPLRGSEIEPPRTERQVSTVDT